MFSKTHLSGVYCSEERDTKHPLELVCLAKGPINSQ